MSARAVKTLYRLFIRTAAKLDRQGISLEARMPMDKSAWLQNGGAHGWATPSPEYSRDALHRLVPWLASPDHPGTFTAAELKDGVRRAFRQPVPAETDVSPLDRAFTSLRILGEQLHMAQCSSSCTTEGVRVDVTTEFLGRQNELDASYDQEDDVPPKYYFTYRVRISNVGERTVQLQSRHWVIRNHAGVAVAEVARGAKGVVGCTPILKPNTCFQYYSGTDLEGPGGSMEGSFAMAVLNAKGLPVSLFEAGIERFKFLVPAES